MRYFKKFLVNDSRTDDVDIFVHCDMTIFDWLVRYIHNRPPKAVLTVGMVASILISSHFLGIDALVELCVGFMYVIYRERVCLVVHSAWIAHGSFFGHGRSLATNPSHGLGPREHGRRRRRAALC